MGSIHFQNGCKKAQVEIGNKLSVKNDYNDKVNLHIICRDSEGSLRKLVEYIKQLSAPGHSFSVVVDPDDSENRKSFGIDGDGAFQIMEIK